MSLSYTHLLIPVSPEYRPEPKAIAAFGQGIMDNGNVPSSAAISYSRVINGGPRVRTIRNAITGQTIEIPLSSRKVEKPLTLHAASEIVEKAVLEPEYDVAFSGEGTPVAPPAAVGYVEDDRWIPMAGPHHIEVRCRVRSKVVRLYRLEREEELNEPPDFSKLRPRFDEDCSTDERDGIFVHPEVGAIRIPRAGCGTFWIEVRYGNFLFPRLINNGVNVLENSFLSFAREIFITDFVQACDWG